MVMISENDTGVNTPRQAYADTYGELPAREPLGPEDAPEVESDPLAEYTDAQADLLRFQAENHDLMREYNRLVAQAAETKANLENHVRLNGDCENASWTAKLQMRTSRWYAPEILLSGAPYLKEVPGLVSVRTEFDDKLLKGQIKSGAIRQEVLDAALCVEPLTPAVLIRAKTAKVEVAS